MFTSSIDLLAFASCDRSAVLQLRHDDRLAHAHYVRLGAFLASGADPWFCGAFEAQLLISARHTAAGLKGVAISTFAAHPIWAARLAALVEWLLHALQRVGRRGSKTLVGGDTVE